ncbi:MAG: tyrosine-protein phosphatase [Eubacterium sp.]|nr:tyrosine-protein phosphatase [Eubacterium sp.]
MSQLETRISEISRYGNITLCIIPEEMEENGYEPADIISVRIGSAKMQMPVGTEYSDADSGEPVCCLKSFPDGETVVVLAVNSGCMAEVSGIAKYRETDEDPGYEWIYAEGMDETVPVYISMAEKQGYADEYAMHQLGMTRTNNRKDYAELSDADYANFHAVETAGMGKKVLFRSSSPINPALNRNREADEALRKAGIKTVMNMTDSEKTMRQYPGFDTSGYAACDIIALDMSMDYFSEDSRQKLAEGFRFLASHDGPYLIHCNEGKDRTGFASGILECLMGADADDIAADYMQTFYNYYGVKPGMPQYKQIAAANKEAALARAFHISSLRESGINLAECAEKYLAGIGMREEEIIRLKESLRKDFNQ